MLTKARALIDSSSEVRVTWTKTLLLLGAIVVCWNVVNHVWYRKTGDPWFGIQVDPPAVSAQAAATVEATPTPTVEADVMASVSVEYVEVVVTATPTPVPPTPEVVYVNVPYEVVRVVTETMFVHEPTPTPKVLAPGVVEICVRVEGAREIYVGNVGVVSGHCSTFAFGVGQTTVPVQINK